MFWGGRACSGSVEEGAEVPCAGCCDDVKEGTLKGFAASSGLTGAREELGCAGVGMSGEPCGAVGAV